MTTALSPKRRWAVQWRPNLIREERRLVLARLYWDTGTWHEQPSQTTFCSHKLSVSICFHWRKMWLGGEYKSELWGFILYLCLLPCLPLRVHLKRSYGGSFI